MLLKTYNAIGDNEVVSVEKTVFGLNEFGELNPIITQGAINDSSLTITAEAAEIVRKGTKEISLCMYTAVWEWAENKPVVRYEDLYTVNWIENVFTQGSFYAQDTGRNSGESEPHVITDYDNPALSNQGGIGHYNKISWKYDCVGGGALLLLEPSETMRVGTNYRTGINFNIVHNRNPLGIGISLGYEGNGVVIDAGLLSDSASRSTTFHFSR